MEILTHSKIKAEEKLISPDKPQYSGLLAMKNLMGKILI
jgi:hypothetical protein|tara:strand:- start:123 stop:239 length:117 start_codon:yes stop_codon:yes gene_type:complete